MALTCPSCKFELHAVPNRTGVAAVCGGCGGMWLDNASSRSILTNFLEASVKEMARGADAMVAQKAQAQAQAQGQAEAAPYRAPASPPTGEVMPRTCAQCGGALAQSFFEPARIMLDVCGAHGTWFDAGELWAMAQHFEMKAAMDDGDAQAFGKEMQAYRNADALNDFRGAGLLVGLLRR